jgi:hypothetical protein
MGDAERVRAWMAVRQAVFQDLYDEAQLVSSRRNVLARPYSDATVANRRVKVWRGATENGP